jgi:pimeloyl-ACP methyl ester carboxylesterase
MNLMLTRRDGNLYSAVLCIALILSSSLTGKTQTPIKSRPLPIGTLVDVGGYRVHLYCIGQGSPTVMIVGAAFSFDWALVQPDVAKFTRVCTFDPSGTAWSDPFKTATAPTCNQRVNEIHQLVMKAPVDGPYILVGYSVGAQWARLYAAGYPNNIVGLVIVDHAFIGDPGKATPRQAARSHSLPQSYSPPTLVSEAPIVLDFQDDLNFSKLPKDDQELHTWALSENPIRPDYEMAEDCFSDLATVTGKSTFPLRDMPLIVISTPNETSGYPKLQAKLLALSRNSKHIIAWNSTHMVLIDEPEVITESIHKVVNGYRRPARKPEIP